MLTEKSYKTEVFFEQLIDNQENTLSCNDFNFVLYWDMADIILYILEIAFISIPKELTSSQSLYERQVI